MAPFKLCFDFAGIASLAYLACVPSKQIIVAPQTDPAALVGATRLSEAGSSPSEPGPIHRADDGLFYVWAKVNGAPVRFLVDTGASVIVLTPGDARRAKVATQGSTGSGKIETASGTARMRWARVDRITVAGRDIHALDAAIVDRGLRVSLLGQNLLTKLDGVAIDGNRLQLR